MPAWNQPSNHLVFLYLLINAKTLSIFVLWKNRGLFRQFLVREITSRYLGSISGSLWMLVHPLAQLAIYSLVFTVIFRVRFPELQQHGFVVFVAMALWPWLAFQEGVQRAVVAISANAGLIKKIALPHELLVYAAVGGSFVVHIAGFVLVVSVLSVFGADLHLETLPAVLLLLAMLALLAVALSLLLAALQIFLKDVEHVIAPLFMFLFYVSPVLYPITLVPEPLRSVIAANPMSYFMGRMRELFMFGDWAPRWSDAWALAGCLLLFYLARRFFLRCAGRFEEFL
jgi:ABC-type polysaccharide/polyol phosphate export permease